MPKRISREVAATTATSLSPAPQGAVARTRPLPGVAEGTPMRPTQDRIGASSAPIGLWCLQVLLPQLAGAKYKPLTQG
jgi:hypothetical protein